jgi:DNA-binding XRE family transcriptional regulator
MDFATIKAAGLTQGEFAHLCDVSRVTTNLWVKGRMGPNKFLKQRVADTLAALAAAVADGRLPLKDTPKDRRADLLKEIVDSHAVTAE